MLFNSIDFLIFLPVVLVVYYVLSTRAQNLWLLAASYTFEVPATRAMDLRRTVAKAVE